jgi:hypothetical protein
MNRVAALSLQGRSLIDLVKRHRRYWLGLTAIIFIVGCITSVRQLRLDPSDLHLLPAATILLILSPLSLVYGAVGLFILGLGTKSRLAFGTSFRANAIAQISELLPIPGGAIVRTGALVAGGAAVGRSALLVTAGALLWIAVAASAAGTILWSMLAQDAYLWMAGASLLAAVGLVAYLARLCSPKLAGLLLVHRLAGCLVIAARLDFAFWAVGKPLPATTAFVFALATIAGSAASIAPAGLGISELFGAALASVIHVDPFAAFIAIALNRLLGLVCNGAVVAILEQRQGRLEAAHG